VTALLRRVDLRYGAAVAAVLAVALALRLWGMRSGLPWVYNVDEAQHFVPLAVGMQGGNLNPDGYFANPPAFTYLLAGLFRLWLGGGVGRIYYSDHSTQLWLIARGTSAVLGTLAVWLLYLAGARLFDRRTGLIAAAVLAVAFLPVFYGKLALNDSPTLAPVCLSLWGSAGIVRFGRRRDHLIAGLGLGLAAATKYTGGIVVLPLVVAELSRWWPAGGRRRAALWLALTAVIAIAAFIAANPYSVIDFHRFIHQLARQSSESEDNGKLGLTYGSGVFYYLWSITWGVGWAPGAAAAAGAVALALRRRWWVVAMLVPMTVAYLAFMGIQGRYFGRWLMPIIPVLCLLAAAAVAGAGDLAARWGRWPAAALTIAGGALLCGQGLVYSIHSGIVNSRSDTRALARAWLVAHVPRGAHVVVEPIVPNSSRPPDNYVGRWTAFPDFLTHRGPHGILYVLAGREVTLENYERTLSPALVGLYQRDGYCWVMTGSTEEGRALVDPRAVPQAIAYYAALAAHATRVFVSSPYAKGSPTGTFNFDWSFEYYPLSYSRPGPLVTIYRLHGGACAPRHAPARRKRHAGPRHRA
jgi:4-amino-4-deoxy-L-arabinose transferase-like glycosyltransferase